MNLTETITESRDTKQGNSASQRPGFRVSPAAWPREPLPLPPRWHRPYELVGTALVPAGAGDMGAPTLDPREELGETYLHLEALDLESEEAILAFCDRHGVLGVRLSGYEGLGPWLRRDRRAEKRLLASVEKARAEAAEWLGADYGDTWWGTGIEREGLVIAPQAETLVEFRFGARCVRECVAQWVALQERYSEELAESLTARLRVALRLFSPSVTFVPGRVRDERAASALVGSRFWSQVPLFNVLLLELFDHIAEGAEYKRCKECNRRFVRQEGRALYRQHRMRGKPPLFCSTAHASTHTTRTARARRKKGAKQRG